MLRKCPRCELNYITETEKYCKICLREMKGEDKHNEIEMCTVCNENPALPGRDVCLFCLKEMNAQQGKEDEEEITATDPNLDIDPVSSMDEIIPDLNEDEIPDKEFGEIENNLSLDEMVEEEEADEDEENEDDR